MQHPADPSRNRDSLRPADVVGSGLCIGCGSCAGQASPTVAEMRMDAYGELHPRGAVTWMNAPSPPLARTCPSSPFAADETQLARSLFADALHVDAEVGRFIAAYVGYAAEPGWREAGSSGGMSSWVAAELLRRGLVDGVAHVGAVADPQADGRFFRYRISRSVDDLAAGAKSRYYPVEMSEVLHAIRATPGRYAVVGIPCFIKAIQLLRREDPVLRERIAFTLGLFCGHMKSARFLDSYARQLGVDPQEVVSADFRRKDASRPANWYTVQFGLRDGRSVWQDWFHLAEGDWGSGFFQNGACDFCDDVVAETADISFGDAWVEPYSQDGRGTNVVLVRSAVLQRIVAEGIADRRLQLEDVDADFVRRTQAAGLRQRREGLAYRLTWPRAGLQPRKRVRPEAGAVVTRRRLVYRARAHISRFSRVLYRLAERCGQRRAYFAWARGVLAVYQGLVYSRGRIGALLDRVWPKPMP